MVASIVQTYYPYVNNNNIKMMLETENGEFQLHFQELGSQITEMAVPVYAPRSRIALIASRARTGVQPTGGFIWVLQNTSVIRADAIISTTGNRAHFIHQISRNTVNYSNIQMNRVRANLCSPQHISNNPVILRGTQRSTMSHGQFVAEIERIRLSLGSQAMGRIAIIVAIGTGVVMSLGFGPAAGMAGLGPGLTGSPVATAIVSGMAGGITQFLRGCFDEMVRIVHPPHGQAPAPNLCATRFWVNNQDRMIGVVARSISNGAFSAATSFIPSPNLNQMADCTLDALARMILVRMANNIVSVLQTIFEAAVSRTEPNWQEFQNGVITNCVIRGLA